MTKRVNTGFTLIELVITMAIVGILTAIALPAYTKHVTKSRRTAAEACLANYASYMERFYATNMSYAQDTAGTAMTTAVLTALNLDCASTSNTGQYYSYGLNGTPTASAYSVQATPQGSQLKNDKQCGTIRIDQSGKHTVTGTSSASVTDCWAH